MSQIPATPESPPASAPPASAAPASAAPASAAPASAAPFVPLRTLARDGTFNTLRMGHNQRYLSDFYHFLMIASWPQFLALVACGYISTNIVFALLYYAGGDCIANARPGSFADDFFFSVQTLATIGYGAMAPATPYAHALVAIEALVGLLGVALATGLVFAKFSRPRARVLFSNVALINNRNGKPHLIFRVANVRANQIVEATLKLAVLRFETTAEGERMRRFYDLSLVRAQNPMFALTWTAMHAIDDKSPLHGLTHEEMKAERLEVLAILVGIDGTFSQTIHARHSYTAEEIIPNARFVDLIQELPDGRRGVDLGVIHDHVPIDGSPRG
jgi:inward rectifier potassium channel